jgi:hypothetical protein
MVYLERPIGNFCKFSSKNNQIWNYQIKIYIISGGAKTLGGGAKCLWGDANHFWGVRTPQKICAWTLCVRPTRKNRQGNVAVRHCAHIGTVKNGNGLVKSCLFWNLLDNSPLKVWFCGQKKNDKKIVCHAQEKINLTRNLSRKNCSSVWGLTHYIAMRPMCLTLLFYSV